MFKKIIISAYRNIIPSSFIIFSFMLGLAFFMLQTDWIDISSLECFAPAKATIVLDDEGDELFRFQLDKRKMVKFQDMPQHLIKAFVAAEDHKFFSHSGISIKGILRSFLVNLYHPVRIFKKPSKLFPICIKIQGNKLFFL